MELTGNLQMLEAGTGMLTITEKNMEQFNALLVEYYNTGEAGELKRFLYNNAIQGVEV